MAYVNYDGTYVEQPSDAVYMGKTDGEHSLASREASVDLDLADEYDLGFDLGTHFRPYLNAINF